MRASLERATSETTVELDALKQTRTVNFSSEVRHSANNASNVQTKTKGVRGTKTTSQLAEMSLRTTHQKTR